jgi:hypothetical protein
LKPNTLEQHHHINRHPLKQNQPSSYPYTN